MTGSKSLVIDSLPPALASFFFPAISPRANSIAAASELAWKVWNDSKERTRKNGDERDDRKRWEDDEEKAHNKGASLGKG